MKNKYLLIFFFVICSCSSLLKHTKDTIPQKISSVEQLILEGITTNVSDTDSIGKTLNNLLPNKKDNYKYFLFDSFNFQNNKTELKILKIEYDKMSFNYINLNCLEICIRNKDSIIVDGFHVNLENISKSIDLDFNLHRNNYTLNHGKLESSCMQKRQVLLHLGIDIEEKKSLNAEEWQIFFQCLKDFLAYYSNIRNLASKNKFGLPFVELSTEKKHEIFCDYQLLIIISFDMSFCSISLHPSDYEYKNE